MLRSCLPVRTCCGLSSLQTPSTDQAWAAVNSLTHIACLCPRSKLNLGIGAYGRSWTLADKTKTTVGSAAWSPGSAGACTGEAGYISWQEIKVLIDRGAKVRLGVVWCWRPCWY